MQSECLRCVDCAGYHAHQLGVRGLPRGHAAARGAARERAADPGPVRLTEVVWRQTTSAPDHYWRY